VSDSEQLEGWLQWLFPRLVGQYERENVHKLYEDLLAVRQAWLEWAAAPPANGDFGGPVVQHLLDSFNQYANWCLSGVTDDETRLTYLADIHRIGTGLLENATNPAALEHWAVSQNAALSENENADEGVRAERVRERSIAPRPGGVLSHFPELIQPAMLRFEAAYDFWNMKALRQLRTRSDPAPTGDISEDIQTVRETIRNDSSLTSVQPERQWADGWQDIEVTFVHEHLFRVQTTAGSRVETRTCEQMGFMSGSKTKAKGHKKAWVVLLVMSTNGGYFASGDAAGPKDGLAGTKWQNVYKHISELAKSFKQQFRIDADPFPYEPSKGYQAAFKINRSSEFVTEAEFNADKRFDAVNLFNDHRSKSGDDRLDFDDK